MWEESIFNIWVSIQDFGTYSACPVTLNSLSSAGTLCKQYGSKLFDTLMVFLKEFFEKVDFEKISRRQKSMKNYPGGKEFTLAHATSQ